MNIVVISASLSENSTTDALGEKLARAAVAAAPGSEYEVISLRTHAHQIMDAMLAGFPAPALEEAFDQVLNADAVVAVTPAYNASMSGLFKSFFDVMDEDTLKGKPLVIGATGGTPRHSLITEHALRPMFSYLHAHVVPTAVYAAMEDWGAAAADSDGAGGASLERRIARAGRELAFAVAAQRGELSGDAGAAAGAAGVGSAGAAGTVGAAAGPVGEAPAKPKQRGATRLAGMSQDELIHTDPSELYEDFASFDQLLKK
ncbi:FMN reductase [Arcanobacterium wilhelmae]|uniref:FMN reductase n=1 Tax=Arcanobacterium wilhelmae TaxID=1803177 RepID=A0ABT9N9N6_9ACTO|nr:CE1759 family FMN reductase [Arcanobacterium wilhelmae]MDP9800424.1 FMN reductase [Arcanobacterium wilhelmae]WFN89848.1 NAD(P)H-dependent oxidoreductase [Arcanobacterium wilhelmae]